MDHLKPVSSLSLALLGSTGSIGRQSLDVARHLGLRVTALAAGRQAAELEAQVREFRPAACALADPAGAAELKIRLADLPVKVYSGTDGICAMLEELRDTDLVLNAIVGMAGLRPTVTALRCGYPLALANKESLVCGGELVMALAKEKNLPILPVDSEHSAIFQSLHAGKREEVRRILLTASGGPFFGRNKEELYGMTAAEALAHPTWSMGAKITVDSATMMNKGFEVIEAVHLFGVAPAQIEVVVHRESVIHSMVEYLDRSVIAQMASPDMRDCIQYAITYPRRLESDVAPLDFAALGKLTIFEPDGENFPLLPLAYDAISRGGVVPSCMNGANEAAVAAFLGGKIPFGKISEIVQAVTSASPTMKDPTLAEILSCGEEAMAKAAELAVC